MAKASKLSSPVEAAPSQPASGATTQAGSTQRKRVLPLSLQGPPPGHGALSHAGQPNSSQAAPASKGPATQCPPPCKSEAGAKNRAGAPPNAGEGGRVKRARGSVKEVAPQTQGAGVFRHVTDEELLACCQEVASAVASKAERQRGATGVCRPCDLPQAGDDADLMADTQLISDLAPPFRQRPPAPTAPAPAPAASGTMARLLASLWD